MPDPISSSTASTAVAGVTLISLMAGLNAGVVLGAFAGAVVFVVTAADIGTFRKILLFAASMIAGVLADELTAALLALPLPDGTIVAPGVGSLVASAVTVKLLQSIIRADTDSLLGFLGRRGGDDP